MPTVAWPLAKVAQTLESGLPAVDRKLGFYCEARRRLKAPTGVSQAALQNPAPCTAPTPKAHPEQEHPATLAQQIFITGLYLYVLALVWLTLRRW